VWTVDLAVEIKLRFQISPAQCGQYEIFNYGEESKKKDIITIIEV